MRRCKEWREKKNRQRERVKKDRIQKKDSRKYEGGNREFKKDRGEREYRMRD